MPKGGLMGGITPARRKIKIEDSRKMNAFGEPISKPRTGEYDEDVIKQIATAAIRQGVEPYTALGVGMQESGLGTYDTFNAQNNWGQVLHDKWDKDPDLQATLAQHKDLNPNAVALSYILKKGLDKKSGNEALDIQDYNGYLLKPNNDIGATKMYGIDLTKYPQGYDLRKDPRYGKSVIDLRENVLKKNPQISELINGLQQPKQQEQSPFTGVAIVPSGNGKAKFQFKNGDALVNEVEADPNEFQNSQDKALFLKSLFAKKQGIASSPIMGN